MREKGDMELSRCLPDVWIRYKHICWGGERGHTVVVDLGCVLRIVHVANDNVFNCALM